MYKTISNKILLDCTGNSTIYRQGNTVIKVINKYNFINYRNEFNILNKLDHKNIIKIHKTHSTNSRFYMYMDNYPCGDLHYNISQKRIINRSNIPKLIYDVCNPIQYVHSKNIVHLDLKPENYLLNHNNNNDFTLIDFQGSKYHNSYYDLKKNAHLVYTKLYASPEVIDDHYCKASDMYSIGVFLYAFCTDKIPVDFMIDKELLNDRVPPHISNFISDLLSFNHNHRPSIHDIQSYKWIKPSL